MFLLNQTYQERCGRAILSSGREINKFKYSIPKVIPMDTKKATPLQIRYFLSTLNSAPWRCVPDMYKRWHSAMLVHFCPDLYFQLYLTSSLDTDCPRTHTFTLVLTAQMHPLNFNQLNATHPNERSKFKLSWFPEEHFDFFSHPTLTRLRFLSHFMVKCLSFYSLVISSISTYSEDLHLTHLSDCPIIQLPLG